VVCGEDPQPKDGEIDEETDPAGRALVLAVVLMAAVPVVASVTPTAGVRPMSRCTKRRCATSSRSSA
jgi:hypothetical protein